MTVPVADIRFLSRMNSLVHIQLMQTTEKSTTVVTLEFLYI